MSTSFANSLDMQEKKDAAAEDILSSLIVDKRTRRLLNLTASSASSDRSDADVQEIIAIVNQLSPKLLHGLTTSNCRQIAKEAHLECYKKDTTVFLQNDPPDNYYTIVRGAVSIHAKVECQETKRKSTDEQNSALVCGPSDRSKYGKFIAQLLPGSSFGELSFDTEGNHSLRSASVVSDGNHGDSQVLIESDSAARGSTIAVEASNYAILLCIPEKTYMIEMFDRDATEHQTKEKLAFLMSSFLFSQWSKNQLIKLAYEMKIKSFGKDTTIGLEGEHIQSIYMIKKGKVKVSKRINSNHGTEVFGRDDAPSRRAIDIAELGERDLFGIVEVLTKSRKWKREVTTHKHVQVYSILINKFVSLLNQESRTTKLLSRVVQKRRQWEALRMNYAKNLPLMPRHLPGKWRSMSLYEISPKSVLSESEQRLQKEKKMKMFYQLREARACYRLAVIRNTSLHRSACVHDLQTSQRYCEEARLLAKEAVFSEGMKTFLNDVTEQERLCGALWLQIGG